MLSKYVDSMTTPYKKNEEDRYICSHCPYTARIQSTMHYHLKKHQGALPHACKHCSQKFLQKSLLDLHISARHKEVLQTQEQNKFKCPCCSYEDIRKGNRMIHFLRVHLKDCTNTLKIPIKDATPYVASCKGCTNQFKSMTQFYYHASSCVTPNETHKYYKDWKSIQ